MPTYQYSCKACGHELEAVQSFSDDPLTECPQCSGQLRKVFSAVGVVFKGSGFYRTDSRVGNGSKGSNGSGGSNGSNGSNGKGSESSGSASKDSSGSDASNGSSGSGASKSSAKDSAKSGTATS